MGLVGLASGGPGARQGGAIHEAVLRGDVRLEALVVVHAVVRVPHLVAEVRRSPVELATHVHVLVALPFAAQKRVLHAHERLIVRLPARALQSWSEYLGPAI